jgi:AcrR family transcriptional regulator
MLIAFKASASSPMPRLTKAEVDAEIVDRAAMLFARHSFEHTSLQQIADAVKYSKAGLLHHYPSKRAIYEKVLVTCLAQARSLLSQVDGIPPGIDRDRTVVKAAVELALDWPGISAFANSFAAREPHSVPELTEIGFIMYQALGIDMEQVQLERLIRVTVAFSGLSMTASVAAPLDLKRAWQGAIVEAAMGALGH